MHILVVLGLEILHVDLSGHGLVAVLHAGIALAHLYAFHPRAGHIAQGIGYCGTTEVGEVLGEHLHVFATESEQLDLLGTCGGIVVAHVDRRVGGEALAEVAAGSFEELVLRDDLSVHGTFHAHHTGLAADHLHLVERLVGHGAHAVEGASGGGICVLNGCLLGKRGLCQHSHHAGKQDILIH